ncbi:Copine-domain-containing protein [Zopfochytrium polystomum]|nr:Copine-domain-containing protein [Zopfochytrium polystomum]
MWGNKRNSAVPSSKQQEYEQQQYYGSGSASGSSSGNNSYGGSSSSANLISLTAPSGAAAPLPTYSVAPHLDHGETDPFADSAAFTASIDAPPVIDPSGSTLKSQVNIRVSCTDLVNRDLVSKSDPQVYVWYQHVGRESRLRVRRTASVSSVSSGSSIRSGDSAVEVRMGSSGIPEVAGGWKLFKKSAQINDELNPVFPDVFTFDYFFEEVQNLCVVVVDVDDNSGTMQTQDYLGHATMSIAQIVSAGSSGYTVPLQTDAILPRGIPSFKDGAKVKRVAGKTTSKITLLAATEDEMRKQFVLGIACRGLDRKDANGYSDPYFVVSRIFPSPANARPGTGPRLLHVFKSTIIKKNLNPRWPSVQIPYKLLSPSGTNSEPIRISVWDWDATGGDDFIGAFDTNLSTLLSSGHSAPGSLSFPLINPKKARGVRSMFYKNSGNLSITEAAIVQQPTFLDFIAAGAQIGLAVAIDLTASNQNPHHPTSLHHFPELARGGAGSLAAPAYSQSYQPPPMNPYQSAIVGVGQVLQEYDTDKVFPLYGFGFERPRGHRHKVDFFGNVEGVGGLLEKYKSVVCDPQVSFSGPTDFAPVLNQVMADLRAQIAADPSHLHYGILLLITDGLITDLDMTLNALVTAASLPLSIVVVGVGNEDFSMMQVLDGDDDDGEGVSGWRSRAVGGKARDIVQFVAMREVGGDPFALARETLAEIPGQFMEFVRMRGIKLEL